MLYVIVFPGARSASDRSMTGRKPPAVGATHIRGSRLPSLHHRHPECRLTELHAARGKVAHDRGSRDPGRTGQIATGWMTAEY
jgi:hypothetical protein